MQDKAINDQLRRATLERIASYTVGIAVEKNTGVGTGTLVTDGIHRYILTAAHAVAGADISKARFWLKPPTAIIEKAAIDTTNNEVGRLTVGYEIPIVEVHTDPKTDTAVLKIDDGFVMPEGPEVYPLAESHEFAVWPGDSFDETSLFLFGFPVANARALQTVGNNTTYFLGAASFLIHYSVELNATGFPKLPHRLSSNKDFLIAYTGEQMHPGGFSGCGIWVASDYPNRLLWRAEPLLIGVAHTYFAKSQVIVATKLPSIVTITPT